GNTNIMPIFVKHRASQMTQSGEEIQFLRSFAQCLLYLVKLCLEVCPRFRVLRLEPFPEAKSSPQNAPINLNVVVGCALPGEVGAHRILPVMLQQLRRLEKDQGL